MTSRPVAVLALGSAVALGACALCVAACTRTCTNMGCYSFVEAVAGPLAKTYAAELPVTAELCLDAACHLFTVSQTGAQLSCEFVANAEPYSGSECTIEPDGTIVLLSVLGPYSYDGGPYVARLRVMKYGSTVFSTQTKAVTFTRSAPNGEACGPICYQTSVDLRP